MDNSKIFVVVNNVSESYGGIPKITIDVFRKKEDAEKLITEKGGQIFETKIK